MVMNIILKFEKHEVIDIEVINFVQENAKEVTMI